MKTQHFKMLLKKAFFDLDLVSLTLLLSPVVNLNANVFHD
jgi:hypothetical protein